MAVVLPLNLRGNDGFGEVKEFSEALVGLVIRVFVVDSGLIGRFWNRSTHVGTVFCLGEVVEEYRLSLVHITEYLKLLTVLK